MTDQRAVPRAIIKLMSGVVYRELDADTWQTLQRSPGPIRDHFATIGVDVVLDATEGYAYLASLPDPDDAEPLPRLMHRRQLSYPLSVLLVLLRKRLLEFETAGDAGRLVVTGEEIREMLRVFQAESANEARLADQSDALIKKAVDLGFLAAVRGERDHVEVRRILKAYVDAQTLGDFAAKLDEYAAGRAGGVSDD